MKLYAIKCYLGDKRKFTNKLTKKEAAIFRTAALHLADYLKKTYKI